MSELSPLCAVKRYVTRLGDVSDVPDDLKRPPTGAASRRCRDIAGPATEIGTILGLNDLKAVRDGLNNWHLSVLRLIQASLTTPVLLH
jgi:hypothetical protein